MGLERMTQLRIVRVFLEVPFGRGPVKQFRLGDIVEEIKLDESTARNDHKLGVLSNCDSDSVECEFASNPASHQHAR